MNTPINIKAQNGSARSDADKLLDYIKSWQSHCARKDNAALEQRMHTESDAGGRSLESQNSSNSVDCQQQNVEVANSLC